MAIVVMDALSHQAIRATGQEARFYRAAPERTGLWRGKRLSGLERCLADLGHSFAIARPAASALASASVLIIASRSQELPFNGAELLAIREFVLGGGGLLLMANHRRFILPQQQVAVALTLPIAFNDTTIGGFPEIELDAHSISAGCEQLVVRNTTSLVGNAPSEVVAHFAVDGQQLFAVACAAGNGRVLATGDSGFIASLDDTGRAMFESGSNERFFANAVSWLTSSA